jgi:hypothetical protein
MDKQLNLFPPNSRYYELIHQLLVTSEAPGNVALSLASVKQRAKAPVPTVRCERLAMKGKTATRFRKLVATNLLEVLDRLDDGHQIREYLASAALEPYEIEHLNLAQEERIRDQIQLLADPLALEIFRDRKDFMSTLRYSVVSIQPKDGPLIHCFSFCSEHYELQRSRWIAVFQGHGDGYYDEIPPTGFLFAKDMDCFCCGDDMFIINKEQFHRIFRFYEYVRLDASKAIRALHDRVPIVNVDAVLAAVQGDSRMAMRLATLPQRPHFDSLAMPRVKRQIVRKGLCVEVVVQAGQEMIVYSPRHKSDFLELLCDDIVRSDMTGLEYSAPSKRLYKSRRATQAHNLTVVDPPLDSDLDAS